MRKGCTSTKCHSAPGILVVLPNGCKEVFAINQSNTFGDLKRKIELQVGLPVELQNLELTDFDHPVGDWISTDILNGTNGSVVYLRTDRKWTQVIYACLRKGTEKALDILSSIEDSSVIENIIFVALLVSAAVGNEELITTLIEEAEEYLNLKGRTSSGRTILHIVVAGGHWTCIEALLSKIAHDFGGIDLLYVKDNDFESPLDIAKRAEQLDIVTKIKDFEFSHRSQYCLSREGSKEAICNPEVRMSKTDKFKPVHLKVSRQHSVPVGESLKAHSTPSSPHLTRPNKTNRLLHRPALTLQLSQNLSGSESDLRRLKRNSKARKTSLGSSLEGSPSISPCSLSPNSTPGHSPSHLSPTGYSYSSLYQRRRSSTEGEAHSAPHSPVTRSQKFMFDGGLHQVVHVPLWRRRGVNHNKEQDYGRRGSSARGYLSHSEGDHNVSDDEKHFEKYARTKRAVSVAAITTEQVKGSLNQKRLQKPWNQYKMVLQSDEQVAFPARVMSEETRRSSCKSFEEWLIEKEVEREQLFAQMTEEERKKAEEKEKLEQERRARCKSYEKWLVGKEVEEESIKEEEKRKEFEKQREEEKRKERKDVAEQKYEKWVQEKFKEELRKEEELRRLMKDKWKKREKSSSLRKESVGTVVKQPLVKTRSVPVL